jgi:hypothetical protein
MLTESFRVTSNRHFQRTDERIERTPQKSYKKFGDASSSKKLAIDNEEFQALDKGYLSHHFKCITCIAAGRGSQYGNRCDLGAMLWDAYSVL